MAVIRKVKATLAPKARCVFKHWQQIIETLTLCAVIAYTIVACRQLEQMRLATQATKESADAATTAAKVAKRTLEQSENFSSKSLAQTKEQSKSMAASAAAAEESAKVADLALRISERAYVGMASGNGFNFATGSTGGINLVIKNTGRTPALDCVTLGAARIVSQNEKITVPPLRAPGGPGTTVQPGAGFTLRSDTEFPVKLGENLIQGLKAGKLRYYFAVSIWYRDVFSPKLHSTFICRQLAADLTTTVPCVGVTDHED